MINCTKNVVNISKAGNYKQPLHKKFIFFIPNKRQNHEQVTRNKIYESKIKKTRAITW